MVQIEEIKEGAVFVTKKGHRIDIVKVYEDFDNGSADTRRYVHRDSDNCKSYSWGHNTKTFMNVQRIKEGKKGGLIAELNNRGFKLKE